VARLPAGQVTRDVGGEAALVRWAVPAELGRDEHPMLPPTRVTLRELAACPDIEAVLAAAAGRDVTAPIAPQF
jgi:hypothetical protein